MGNCSTAEHREPSKRSLKRRVQELEVTLHQEQTLVEQLSRKEERLRRELSCSVSGRPKWEWLDNGTWRAFDLSAQGVIWGAHDSGGDGVVLQVQSDEWFVDLRNRSVQLGESPEL